MTRPGPCAAPGPDGLAHPTPARASRLPQAGRPHRPRSLSRLPRPSRAQAARCPTPGPARAPSRRVRPRPRGSRRRCTALVASRALSATGTLTSTCGKRRMTARSSLAGLPVSLHRGRKLQRGHETVAGGVVLEEDDVARLLAAEHRAGRLQLLEHVAVADLRLDDVDAVLAHGDLEAQVAITVETTVDRAAACPAPSSARRRSP